MRRSKLRLMGMVSEPRPQSLAAIDETHVLELDGLSKRYGTRQVVDALNLHIDKGGCFGLRGPNGAGKTTTVRMISTLTPKSGGDIRIFGQSIDRDMLWIKRRIGVVPQRNNLENDLTAWENLELHGLLYGMPKAQRRARIEELLDFTELSHRRDDVVKDYSGGMKRKIMIALGLMHSPTSCSWTTPRWVWTRKPAARSGIWCAA